MIRRIHLALTSAAFATALACSASAQQATTGAGTPQQSALEVVGTGDGIDVLRALSSAFNTEKKSVEIQIPPSIGSGGGIAAVGSGKSVLGRVARKLTDSEVAQGLVYKPIAILPSAIFVNPSAGVKSITAKQLSDIFNGKITNWKDVGGEDLRVRVVRREDADSTLTVLRSSMPGWKDLVFTDKSKMAMTTQEAVATVREVQGAVGFGPYSKDLDNGLTVLRIDGHHPIDDRYPSSATLALIYLKDGVTPEAKTFVEFCDSRKARDIIASLGSVAVQR